MQVAELTLEYSGTLAPNKFISLVAETLNRGDPCSAGYATAPPDSLHSGVMQAGGNLASGVVNKQVTLRQETFLDSSQTFSLCYAAGAGNHEDATWTYSG